LVPSNFCDWLLFFVGHCEELIKLVGCLYLLTGFKGERKTVVGKGMGETGVEQQWEKGYCPLQLFIRGCAYGVTLSNTPRSVAGCFVKTMGSSIKDFHTEREVK